MSGQFVLHLICACITTENQNSERKQFVLGWLRTSTISQSEKAMGVNSIKCLFHDATKLWIARSQKGRAEAVLSHPQALDQCEMALSKFDIVKVSADNTAGAAQDNSDNVTRFLILAREPMIPRTDRLHKVHFNMVLIMHTDMCFCILDQTPLHINLGKYIATNVPSLKGFSEEPTCQQQGISTLQAISTVMFQLLSDMLISYMILCFAFHMCES
nr:arogenate dehydratase/prephenate dehydratase 1, chloroplastic-like [Ipomoea batatas]